MAQKNLKQRIRILAIKKIAFNFLFLFLPVFIQAQTISLSGTWQFATDPADKGIAEKWYLKTLAETVRLPGTMADNGKGNAVSVGTKWTGDIIDKSYFTDSKYEAYRQSGNIKMPFWLNPQLYYSGAAWYQKTVVIPANWKGKNIRLFLERCHWETRLWIDDKEVGIKNSLGTPNEFDLTSFITPGKHRITICIDNRVKDINVGVNSHSVSDHTQGNWNGMAGKLELIAEDPVRIKHIDVFPDIKNRQAKLKISVSNATGKQLSGTLIISASGIKKGAKKIPAFTFQFKNIQADTIFSISYTMGKDVLLWDEFDPNLYKLSVSLKTASSQQQKEVVFGMREFKTAGTRLTINDRPVFLRGTLECAIFPKTQYPPTHIDEWLRIFKVIKSYGLNHMRFHSYCPPEAAFVAADQLGVYLHVECSSWANQGVTIGDGKPIDQFIYDESERIVAFYGNHPSFCMMLYGNEPAGDNQAKYLSGFVSHWKDKDTRRVYSSGAGWPNIPENDFISSMDPRIQGWGEGLNSVINAQKPNTLFDFRKKNANENRPVVSHEIGQWCVYPNFKEIPKYTGNLKAKNFEIFRDDLIAKGMGNLAEQFLMASGKLQALCYRADIEAALRTPGFGGFQLLDLHDFPGQGTALVGVLDAFWDDKGYINAKEFSRFCNAILPLARIEKRIFVNNETFSANIEGVNFGKEELKNTQVEWTIKDGNTILTSGKIPVTLLRIDNCQPLGTIQFALNDVLSPRKLNLFVNLAGHELDWDFWVYPAKKETLAGEEQIRMVQKMDAETEQFLLNGGKVLLNLKQGSLSKEKGGDIKVGFSSIFWNTAWTGGQPPHTLGILCNPLHPALADFPTEYHSNWQWWDAMSHSGAINLESLPKEITPIVRVIDDWFKNRPLSLVFEANVGKGKIIVSGIDLETDIANRPEAQQLLYSLKKYMTGLSFNPSVNISIEKINQLF
jgi:hypothetical protein